MTTQALQYSYSGADCDVFAIRAGKPIQLKSVATVSVSVYDAKAPVRALGHKNVLGYTGSIRTVAGSIVFVVVEEHPLKELMTLNVGRHHVDIRDKQVENVPKLKRGHTYPIGSISPFKLMLIYHNEIGNGAGLEIDNVEFVSEGIVTSVNDMVTEVVVQFVATGFRQLRGTNKLYKKVAKPVKATTSTNTKVQKAKTTENAPINKTKNAPINKTKNAPIKTTERVSSWREDEVTKQIEVIRDSLLAVLIAEFNNDSTLVPLFTDVVQRNVYAGNYNNLEQVIKEKSLVIDAFQTIKSRNHIVYQQIVDNYGLPKSKEYKAFMQRVLIEISLKINSFRSGGALYISGLIYRPELNHKIKYLYKKG